MNDVSPTRDSSGYSVHIGTWTNWSRGSILGATLTLDRQNGGLLIAALALFIAWVGSSFWRICCFVFHQVYSKNDVQDGLYHHRQAILRNTGSPWRGLTGLLHTGWAWRRNSKLSFCRTLPMVLCAAVCGCAFVIASLFSSMVATSSDNEVLISSPDCGYTSAQLDNPDTLAAQTFEPYLRRNALSYANYARQCYHTNASAASECSRFVKENLLGNSEMDASCVFGDNICQSASANLVLDTGLLDSNDDFGLNAPFEERFQYRRRVHCAPLKTEGYSRPNRTRSGRRYMRYYYGSRITRNVDDQDDDDDYTYEYNDESLADLIETKMTSSQPDYTLSGVHSFSVNSTISTTNSNFEPIPPLRIPNADVSLFFLSGNQVVYTVPTNDSWYRGNLPIQQRDLASSSLIGLASDPGTPGPYFSSEAASPLACAVQVQYCSTSLPEDRRCSPLASAGDALANMTAQLQDGAAGDETTTPALRRFQWLAAATTGRALDLATAVSRLGAQLLTARDRLQDGGGVQGALPADQWQADVRHWHATTMAQLQGLFVETAMGPPLGDGGALMPWLVRPAGEEEEGLCRSQKILSPTHTSFALFPLCLILAAGACVILTSWLLPPLLVHLARRRLLLLHTRHRFPSTSSSTAGLLSSAAAAGRPASPDQEGGDQPQAAAAEVQVDPTTYARYEWLATATPQLVRLAHEGVVQGASTTWAPPTWTRGARGVPVTATARSAARTKMMKKKKKKKSAVAARAPTPALAIAATTDAHAHAATATSAGGAAAMSPGRGRGGYGDDDYDDNRGLLAVLDLTDPSHPRLAPPAPPPPPPPAPALSEKIESSQPKLPEICLRDVRRTSGTTSARTTSTAVPEGETECEREEVLLMGEPLLPDYENWPLPPSGSLTPTLEGEGELAEERRRRKEGVGSRGEGTAAAAAGGARDGGGRDQEGLRKKTSWDGAFGDART